MKRWRYRLYKANDEVIELDIPTRLANGLKKNGIRYFRQLLKWRNQYDYDNFIIAVTQLKGFGEKSADYIEDIIRRSFKGSYN